MSRRSRRSRTRPKCCPNPDMKELAQEELHAAKADVARLEDELKILLLPKDPNDDKNIFVEIRGGAGGEESALFAADLYRMYTIYADKRGWQTEVMSASRPSWAATRKLCSAVAGDKVYSRLKFESGVHRVQRVPETESQGRVHTSTTNGRGAAGSGRSGLLPRPERSAHRHIPFIGRGAASISIKHPRRFASRTSRPVRSWNVRTSAASTRTRIKRCACCAAVCTRPRSKSSRPPSQLIAKVRSARATARNASAPITFRKTACRPPHQADALQARPVLKRRHGRDLDALIAADTAEKLKAQSEA